MQKGKNTTAWGRRSRGSHHSVGQQLAGGSHWRTASHPSPTAPATKTCRRAQGAPTRRRSRGSHHSVGQQLAGGSHWLTASHPFRRKSGMDGARSHCMEQTLAGLAPLRGAAARGARTTAWGSSSREARTGLLLPTHSAEKRNGWGTEPLHGADARGARTTAWGSSSREARTGVLLPAHSAEKRNGWGTELHAL